MPEYEIILWNEDNFKIKDSVQYVRQAYEAKKFAFVADFVRLYVLHKFGGIYLDIDVEAIKSFDDLLQLKAFGGFENKSEITTGVIASEKEEGWVKEQLDYYNNRSFITSDGGFDMTTNVEIATTIMKRNGFRLDNSLQVYKNMHFFPKDYFCPKSNSGQISLTENTYCIHHFYGSWQPKKVKLKKLIFHKILGPNISSKLINLKQLVLKKGK